jgi:hypothetical protein
VYRTLNSTLILQTTDTLVRRIDGRFPGSGLGQVAAELVEVAAQTEATIARLRRPNWALRGAIVAALVLLFAIAVVIPVSIGVRSDVPGISDLLQGIEAAINNVIFLVIGVFFLATLEIRPKRKRALAALHELRSLAHVIDMHQLTKDPDEALHGALARLPADGELASVALAHYLDYCTELLSIISKLAALYAQYLNDAQVLSGVNDVQQLADGLSSKIWQKIMILDTIAVRTEMPR